MSEISIKEIFVTIKGIGFTFLYDKKSPHNLMSPMFLSFFKENYSSVESLKENQRVVKEIMANSKEPFPVLPPHLHYFCFVGVYKEVGCEVIKCSDNKFRKCKAVRFTFQLDEKDNTKVFYIDQSLCKKRINAVVKKL